MEGHRPNVKKASPAFARHGIQGDTLRRMAYPEAYSIGSAPRTRFLMRYRMETFIKSIGIVFSILVIAGFVLMLHWINLPAAQSLPAP